MPHWLEDFLDFPLLVFFPFGFWIEVDWTTFTSEDWVGSGVDLVLTTICDEARVESDEPFLPIDEVEDCVVMEPTFPSR